MGAAVASDAYVKSVAVNSIRDFVLRNHGDTVWNQCTQAVPETQRATFGRANAVAWVPTEGLEACFVTLGRVVAGGDRARCAELMRNIGCYIAEDNLSTVYKLVLAFAKPNQIFSMLPRLWGQYFKPVRVTLERPDPNKAFGICTVNGLRVSHLAAAAAGWIQLAYEKVGEPNAKVEEEQYASGIVASDTMIFRVQW